MLKAFARSVAVILCLIGFFIVGGASLAQAPPPQGRPAPGRRLQAGAGPAPETRMGMWRGRPVTYQVIDGRDIYEGDIILENVQPMPKASSGQGVKPASVGLANSSYLWPVVSGIAQIPYIIDSGSDDVAKINSAIGIYNATFDGVIQLVPRTSQANYIDIDLNGAANGSCEATEGDANIGEQFVGGASDCAVATILHEFGHVTGVWHEQSRTDASMYVTFNYGNVIKGSIGNFLPAPDNDQQNLGPYDYASVMEYPAFSFSRNGGPPLDSKPQGMPLSNPVGYSAADIEGIMRLYGTAPTEVTVTSNPPGLQVSVDSSPITTPQTFSWALNSMHTLSVASGVQTVSGEIVDSTDPTTFYYTYGVWSDGLPQSHTITVTPGNGDAGFPVSAPQVATYSANFVQLVPYTPTVFPTAGGSVMLTGTPAPQNLTVNEVAGTYVIARQLATLTAAANSGYTFYEFNNSPDWLPGGLSSNPKTFYVPDTGLTVNTTVDFTTYPVYTVDVSPNTFSSNLSVIVDGALSPSDVPKNFSPDPNYDGSGWNSGTMHSLEFSSPLKPWSVNSQFAFSTWTPGGTSNPLSVTLPGTSQSYIATIDPEFVPADNFGGLGPCGGGAAITPASTIAGGFYPSGTELTYTETPATTNPAGQWVFAGWTFDLTGTTNPDTLTPTDESLVYANFNTTTTPLAITSLTPSSVASGGGSFNLTINGTGFTSASNVGINFPSIFLGPITFMSSTQIQVTVPAADIATPQTVLVFVENYPPMNWSGCAVFAHQPFYVHQGTPSGATTVTATPTTVSFPSTVADTTSTGSAITVKNTGSTATTIAIVASSNFGQSNNCPVYPATLGAGSTCTITPTFTPTATGPLTGNIAVTDSASNSPQVVTLSGTGLTTVTDSPGTLSFGSETVGSTTSSHPITVNNTGTASTTIAVAASANYGQTNNCGTTLGAGAACTINVTFSPTTTGSLPGTVSIMDSASNSPQTVTLSGTGTASTVTVTVTPASEAFASTVVGNTSAPKTITVKNTGTGSTTISVAASTNFAQTNLCPVSPSILSAGASCTISATFTPTAVGALAGSISVTDAASNSPQTVSLTGTGTAQVTVTPATLAFGNEAVGGTSAGKTVTMTNNESSSLSFTFAASANFAVVGNGTSPCGASLASKAKCTMSVTFKPTEAGMLSGDLTITDSAVGEPQQVSLTGTGTEAVATLTFTPTSETFTSTAVGTTSTSKAVTMKNTGTSTATISIAASGDFGESNTCDGTLGAGLSCTITVTFSPTTTGSISGAVTVTANTTKSPQVVGLTGTGIAPLTFSPVSLAFGNEAVGSTSASKTFTVTNNEISALSVSFAASADYAVLGSGTTCTTSLAANAKCTVAVTFTPPAAASVDGEITFTYIGAYSPVEVKLTGKGTGGTAGSLTFTPASLTFAKQAIGTASAAKTVTVKNSSASSVTLSSIAAAGNFIAAGGGATPCGGALAASASCTISVTFNPSAVAAVSGAAVVSDTGSDSPQVVNLTGTGILPVTIAPTSLTFTSTTVGSTSAAQILTLTNNLPTTLSLTSFAASGDFAVTAGGTSPCGASVAPAGTCTLSVTFTPSTTGSIKGAVTIKDGASTSPQTVKLTGTGAS